MSRIKDHEQPTPDQDAIDRAQLLHDAQNVDAEAMEEDISGPGPYSGATDREVAHALHVIDLHGFSDESAGTTDGAGYICLRTGLELYLEAHAQISEPAIDGSTDEPPGELTP